MYIYIYIYMAERKHNSTFHRSWSQESPRKSSQKVMETRLNKLFNSGSQLKDIVNLVMILA